MHQLNLLNQDADLVHEERVVTAADMLNVAAKKLETELATQPRQRAKLQATLGRTCFGLGLYPQAIALQEKVRDYYLATFGPEHADTLRALGELPLSYFRAGREKDDSDCSPGSQSSPWHSINAQAMNRQSEEDRPVKAALCLVSCH